MPEENMLAGESGGEPGSTTPAQPAAQQAAQVENDPAGQQPEPSWRDSLPENLRGDPTLAKYAKTEDALNAFVDAQRLIGRKAEGIVVPGPDAKPEELEAFQKKLREVQHVPDAPDGYELPKLEAMPDGMPELPEQTAGWFKGIAHKYGLTPAQAQGLFADYMQDIEAPGFLSRQQENAQARESGLSDLRKEFAGKTESVLKDAVFAMECLGLSDSDFGPAGNSAKVIKALAGLAPEFREGGMKGKGKPASTMTPDEARAKGREMMRDPRYSDPSRRDQNYVREVHGFFESHFPGEHTPASRAQL